MTIVTNYKHNKENVSKLGKLDIFTVLPKFECLLVSRASKISFKSL